MLKQWKNAAKSVMGAGSSGRVQSRRSGFTLIELLVVIAIIAVLISLLLPAVGKMRLVGWKTVSMSNTRSICVAAFSYQSDHQGWMPIQAHRTQRGIYTYQQLANNQVSSPFGVCTWSFGGKNTSGPWGPGSGVPNTYNGIYDIEAVERPINSYVTSEGLESPPPGQAFGPNDQARKAGQLPVFRDPSDKVGHQRGWLVTTSYAQEVPNNAAAAVPFNIREFISCYDDVGTSYHFSLKWHEQLEAIQPDFVRNYLLGLRRLRAADAFVPSRLVWLHDEYADVVAYNTSPGYIKRNGYGDINKSNMGFMDGHAKYLKVEPGRAVTNPATYYNSEYTFVFEVLR